MIYQVLLGDKILYYPGNDEYTIYDTELTEDVGQAGEFTFKIPSTNPLYNQISNGALITILRDKKEYWRGEIRNISTDFAKVATVYCVEDLAWLADEFIAPVYIAHQTYKQRLDAVIATYNSSRGADRQFESGYVYNGSDTCNWKTEYEWSILDSIRKCICRDNLYVKVSRVYENGVLKRKIDVRRLQEYGKTTSQPIEYGYNLLDYVKEADYGNLTNVVTPYGDELEGDREIVYVDYSKRLQGTTIANNASIDKYGRHAKAVVFDGVKDLATLNSLAASYLSRYSQPQLTMEVKAVDLSPIENVADISIGDQVHIIAKPFSIDQYLYLTEIRRDIQNVGNNTITLSGYVEARTLTSQIISATDEIEELPSEWDLLKAAKRNALAMLLDETQGGYVVFEYDDPNNPASMTAINICNAKTIDASTKRWRWSSNGLGYMERPNIGSSWSTLKVAMTHDGHIVADFIDTGKLTAAIIKTGILSDANGKFSLNMVTGDLVMNSGIFGGSLNAAKGTFEGKLEAATGSFSGKVVATQGAIGGWNLRGTDQATSREGAGALYSAIDNNYLLSPNGTYHAYKVPNVSDKKKLYVKFGDNFAIDVKGVIYLGLWSVDPQNQYLYGKTTGGKSSCLSPGFIHLLAKKSGSWTQFQANAEKGYYSVKNGAFYVNNDGTNLDIDDDPETGSWVKISPYQVSNSDGKNVVWDPGSDRKLKKNIEDLTIDEAEHLIANARPRKFEFKSEEGERYGFIAQELREILDDDNGIEYFNEEGEYHSIYYMDFIAPLCVVVNDLKNQIKELKKEIETLKGEING